MLFAYHLLGITAQYLYKHDHGWENIVVEYHCIAMLDFAYINMYDHLLAE